MNNSFIYFGTPYVARDTLEILIARGYTPSLVVTSPDARRGRGMQLTPSETKECALAHNIPVITPEKLTPDVIAEITSVHADYAIVVAYGKILPEALIQSFPLGVLNIHYSLLPKYRGASPVEAALLRNESMTGVAVQKMVYELDAGDLIALEEVTILPSETTRELRPRLVQIGAELLADILPQYLEGDLTPVAQDHAQATHSGKIKKEEGLLTLPGNDQENWNKYRAYAESPGTYFFMHKDGKDTRVKIVTASFENGAFTPLRVVPEGKKETDYTAI